VIATPDDVLAYWFAPGPERPTRWFRGDAATDADCRQRFASTLDAAARGELDEWTATPRGRLALIVVLDQFSRNVHRGTPRAFAQDARALALCLDGLARGDDRALAPEERAFFYLPLEHAEDRTAQQRSVECLERLCDEVSSEQRPLFEDFLDYARRHRAIIERFGRFPHRNKTLGRASTAEECEFLAGPDAPF
jgi:uncharacterized protein (DUF924 family)